MTGRHNRRVRRPVVHASIVVFVASFCTLVIEIVAGRILAPYVGVSLYTWTSIIGVVLAGISAGAWAGGVMADRRPAASTLGLLLVASGLASFAIFPATAFFAADNGLLDRFAIAASLLPRVVILSFLSFFIPSFLLGMVSPVAVKLAVSDLQTTGRVVGKIYAVSTLGSIAGTFVTGFYLIARFGTRATLAGVAVVLIASGIVAGALLGRRTAIITSIVVVAGATVLTFVPRDLRPPILPALGADPGVVHVEESQYYTIAVERTVDENDGRPLMSLRLDQLIHSYTDLNEPSYLAYGYEEMLREIIESKAVMSPAFRILFIGGGGYTLPRLIAEKYPSAEVDVIEIDPAVTRTAYRFFGVPRDAAITTFNGDARWFVMRADESYDAIVIDAFNDLSVPYHLTTREFGSGLRRLLRPDGVIAVNVIDDFEKGRFMASYVRTLEAVFGEGNVGLFVELADDRQRGRSTFVIVASDSPPQAIAAPTAELVIAGAELRRYLDSRRAIVLTDDYAPVDNMLAPLFLERFLED